jgi:hypothetical protein
LSAGFDRIESNGKTEAKSGRRVQRRKAAMELTTEQERAIQNGQAVAVIVGSAECIVLRKDVYERGEQMDYSPWTEEEMDCLAAETADLVAGDGFDEPDAS